MKVDSYLDCINKILKMNSIKTMLLGLKKLEEECSRSLNKAISEVI